MTLMHRICPVCHEKLTSNDHFFCGNCGNVLEAALISHLDSSKKVIDLDKITIKSGYISKKHITEVAKEVVKVTNLQGIIILLGVLAFVGMPTYIFMSGIHTDLLQLAELNKKAAAPVKLLPRPTVAESTSSVGKMALASALLGNIEFTGFTPYNIDVYVESGDALNSLRLFAVQDSYYKELYESLISSVTSHYSGFVRIESSGVHWAIIFKAQTAAKAQEFVLPQKYSWLRAEAVDDYLLISNSSEILQNAKSAAAGLEKNVNMNPSFVPIRNKISTQGKLVIVALTGDGKSMLTNSLGHEVPLAVKTLVEEHFKGAANYLVIR